MDRQNRQTVIAGNWKMNMLASGCKAYADDLLKLVPGFSKWCETVVCTPFPLLPTALKAFEGSDVRIGAQNVSEQESGAFTGEVSTAQLKDIGAGYVIIGHSERRAMYGDTDELVNKKTHAALGAALRPIVCVGESLEQREIGVTFDLVALQVKAALHGVAAETLSKVVIAYEPIWAIGTGRTATDDQAEEVVSFIRATVQAMYGASVSDGIRVQYGGSMNAANAQGLMNQPNIDGGLIGGASLKAADFAAIVKAASEGHPRRC